MRFDDFAAGQACHTGSLLSDQTRADHISFERERSREINVSIGRLLMRGVFLCGVAGFWVAWAIPVSAQALGDADCPGGYYFHPVYSQCVPYGSEYLPPDYAYAPPVYVTPYRPNYLFLGGPIDHDRDRRDAHRRTFDGGRDRR